MVPRDFLINVMAWQGFGRTMDRYHALYAYVYIWGISRHPGTTPVARFNPFGAAPKIFSPAVTFPRENYFRIRFRDAGNAIYICILCSMILCIFLYLLSIRT